MALYHPDRLRYCQKRTNPKGEEDPGWQRISLAEAFDEAGAKFNEIVDKYGGESVFTAGGTSRIYCMAPYASFKNLFNTPNSITAQQICKGPRHFATIMTDENAASWMEVEQQPLVYMQWGTAVEYSNYDSSCRGVVDIAQRAYKHILVDPRMTPLGKEADIWLPLRVGTDMALLCGMIRWVIDNGAYDDLFVRRWTNAPFLWNAEEDGRTYKGWMWESTGGIDLTSRLITEADCDPDWINQYWDYEGRYQRFICWDENNNKPTYWDAEQCVWEGERHRIPTTGTWIEHPYKPVIADAWLPDPSQFADPEDPEYDEYWHPGNEGGARSNPLGLPKSPALTPGGVEVKLANGKTISAQTAWESFIESLEGEHPRVHRRGHRGSCGEDRRGVHRLHHAPQPPARQRRHPLPAGPSTTTATACRTAAPCRSCPPSRATATSPPGTAARRSTSLPRSPAGTTSCSTCPKTPRPGAWKIPSWARWPWATRRETSPSKNRCRLSKRGCKSSSTKAPVGRALRQPRPHR